MEAVNCGGVENHVEGQQKRLMDPKASAEHRSRIPKVCVHTRAHVCACVCRHLPLQMAGIWTDLTLGAEELTLCRLT